MDDQLRAWVLRALEKEVIRKMPMTKAVRDLKTSQRKHKKELARLNRVLAGRRSAINRAYRERQQEIEAASGKRFQEMDDAAWQRRLDLLSGQR